MMNNKLTPFLLLALAFFGHPLVASVDALDEVNQHRAVRGLRPFARDASLTQAAGATADYRAANLIDGHVNDFAFLPPGANAAAAGCAAWAPGTGWGSCCSEENWTYAGAAYAMGRDGRRYMHLFVSNVPNGQPAYSQPVNNQPVAQAASWQRVASGWWYLVQGKYTGYLHDNRTFQWRRDDGTFSQGQYLEAGQVPRP